MRRILLAAAMLFSLAAAGTLAQAQITIGADLSTTGPVASLGIPNKNAVLLGPTSISGQKIHYVILDDASDTTNAVQNVKRLVSEDNIDVLLGPTGTPLSLAVIDTVAEAKVPTISLGSAGAIVAPMDAKRKWMFKVFAQDEVVITAMVNHMLRNGIKTLSIIAVDDPYGEPWAKVTTKIATEKGIKVLSVERFSRSDPSTTAQALRAMKDKPQAILIAAVGTPAATPHHALAQLGYKGKIYQSGGAVNPDFLRVGGKDLEGSYAITTPFVIADQLPDGYPTKKGAQEFLKLYRAKYGAESAKASFISYPWDAFKMLEVAIPVALKTGAKPGTLQFREALRSALEHVNFVGTSAVYHLTPMDHSGVDERGVAIVRIVNNNWKLDYVPGLKTK